MSGTCRRQASLLTYSPPGAARPGAARPGAARSTVRRRPMRSEHARRCAGIRRIWLTWACCGVGQVSWTVSGLQSPRLSWTGWTSPPGSGRVGSGRTDRPTESWERHDITVAATGRPGWVANLKCTVLGRSRSTGSTPGGQRGIGRGRGIRRREGGGFGGEREVQSERQEDE